MKWPTVPLRIVAPPEPAHAIPEPEAEVWILTLDQIQSGTGRILNRRSAPAREAGTSTFCFDSGNVLYSKLRPYLNKVIWPQELGIATTELVPLRPRTEVLLCGFLTYYLRSPHFLSFAQGCVAGVKMPRLIMDQFWEHEVPLPPLSEQRRIVDILDQADALRRKRTEADAKAERILPALFYKMFGDPATNPKRWPVKCLGDLSLDQPQYGANARAIPFQEGKPRYVRITDITDDGQLSNKEVVTLDLQDWEEFRLGEGDLLFARSGATVGKTYLYDRDDGLCVFAGYLIRFRLDKRQLNPWVAFAYTMTPAYQSWVSGKKRAAAQPNINGQEYASLPLPVPSEKLQKTFEACARELTSLRRRRETASCEIEMLFNTLLRRAFSGDLTAKWREARMKELLREMELQERALRAHSQTKDDETPHHARPESKHTQRGK
jgi:type I restriction enzyme S subunit